MQRIKVTCIVSDLRSLAVAEQLNALGCDVMSLGQEILSEKCSWDGAVPFKCAAAQANILVLPTPAFGDQQKVILGKEQIGVSAQELFSCMSGDSLVFAGRVGEDVAQLAREHGIRLIDYMQVEEIQWRNAIPTAEGALWLAMQKLDITLHGAHVAVLGYGRIATALCSRLRDFGAKVTVAARNPRDLVRIELEGYRALRIKQESSLLPLTTGYDVIFNTVPCRILTPLLMERMHAKTILVELASSPGGWDPTLARCDRAIYAPGLPGKYAPKTAGEIIARVIFDMIKEEKGL